VIEVYDAAIAQTSGHHGASRRGNSRALVRCARLI